MEMETVYQTHKTLLVSVAYRMLGSLSDAEVMVKFSAMNMTRSPKCWIRPRSIAEKSTAGQRSKLSLPKEHGIEFPFRRGCSLKSSKS
jgi:hypothetical protein